VSVRKIDHLNGSTDVIGSSFVRRERILEWVVAVGVQSYLTVVSVSNTKQRFEIFGVGQSHNRGSKADQRRDTGLHRRRRDGIQIKNERRWLYAAVDHKPDEFPHIRLFSTETQHSVWFPRKLRRVVPLTDVAILADSAHRLEPATSQPGCRFRVSYHGDWSTVGRIFKEAKRRTSLLLDIFGCVRPSTAER